MCYVDSRLVTTAGYDQIEFNMMAKNRNLPTELDRRRTIFIYILSYSNLFFHGHKQVVQRHPERCLRHPFLFIMVSMGLPIIRMWSMYCEDAFRSFVLFRSSLQPWRV